MATSSPPHPSKPHASMSSAQQNQNPSQINRQMTTPFHLKLFYKTSGYHHLSDFPVPSPSHPNPPLPRHLQIYTWPSCTLRELTHLLTTALPDLLPDPAVGTRLSYRLVFPDTRPLRAGASERERDEWASRAGRWLSKELGSVVVAASTAAAGGAGKDDDEGGAPGSGGANGSATGTGLRLGGEDADKTLQDARFVIGDYVDCAIFPANADAGTPAAAGPRAGGYGGRIGSGSGGGGGMGGGMNGRENGYYGGSGRGRGRGGGYGMGGGGVPVGEWRRGERIPDSGGYGGRGGYRGGRGRGY